MGVIFSLVTHSVRADSDVRWTHSPVGSDEDADEVRVSGSGGRPGAWIDTGIVLLHSAIKLSASGC